MISSTLSGGQFIDAGYEEVILPVLWEQKTFVDKAGPEILSQMWTFKDKGDRDVCLIPEVTGLIQEQWNEKWSKEKSYKNIFYVSRCYRYERPQKGRYREFTQFGIESLGKGASREEVISLLTSCLDQFSIPYVIDNIVKRGLSYYTEFGFEARCDNLGAQRQIAGGGRYPEGIGWAIGVDRLQLATEIV
jgi:histidyl-tRNA synthetase